MIIPFFASRFGNLRLRPQRPTGSLADLTSDFAFTFWPVAMHANIYRVTFAAADLCIRSSICFYELECSVLIVLDFPQIKIIIEPAGSSPVPVSPPFLFLYSLYGQAGCQTRQGMEYLLTTWEDNETFLPLLFSGWSWNTGKMTVLKKYLLPNLRSSVHYTMH